jgi:hypothetical protein
MVAGLLKTSHVVVDPIKNNDHVVALSHVDRISNTSGVLNVPVVIIPVYH